MSATVLLDVLKSRGIAIRAAGEYLDLDGPSEAMTDELLANLRTHKPELLALLDRELNAKLKAASAGLGLDVHVFRDYMADDLPEIASGEISPDVLRLCAHCLHRKP